MSGRRFLTSVRFAGRGLGYALRTQRNMRIHLAIGAVAVGAAAYFRVSAVEWLFLSVTIALVLVAELINTALEVWIDFVSRERRAEAMVVKDLAAGAVLVCSLSAVVVGVIVFLPRLLSVFTLTP